MPNAGKSKNLLLLQKNVPLNYITVKKFGNNNAPESKIAVV
jgi:hypothetical protein